MNRRRFLQLSAAAAALAGARPFLAAAVPSPDAPHTQFDRYFLPILDGFLKNARATSPDHVVCDYPDGTKLKSCCTPGGKTYVSVARMLPPMAEWLAAGREAGGAAQVRDVLLSVYRNAFDPDNPNFWGYAPSNKVSQLSIEAALVAWSLWRLGDDFVAQLTPPQRANIQKWLASCTQMPERKNNHAWFSACNQACRLELSRKFPEFQGDEAWMLEDLRAMDALALASTKDGWCSDSPDQPIYDIYNFYVFSNFPLMWGRMIGGRYPDWNEKFRARIRTFLDKAPYFFAANGSHPLMGRSLVYRWAVLSPLVLAYQEKLWPHSPGLLRRIVRGQFEYHWGLGCFDAVKGKLRESFSRDNTDVTREPYVDNGHPYWAMLGFAFLSLPADDPFWTAPEEKLPVEKRDFLLRFEGPKFLLSGRKEAGEVRWIQSQNSAKRDAYRDKYGKFVWSSHFGFSSRTDPEGVAHDQALVFRETATKKEATRAVNGVTKGKLLADGVETTWFAQLGDWKFTVASTVRVQGDAETRRHRVTAPAEAVGKVELLEGSFTAPSVDSIRFEILAGYERVEVLEYLDINLIHRRTQCRVAIGPIKSAEMEFAVQQTAKP
jgi:hypothetical protein